MNGPICFKQNGTVAVLSIGNPPVNALSAGVPQALWEAVQKAESDPRIRSVVIHGEGRTFVAGADIHEFQRVIEGSGSEGSGAMPQLHPVLDAIEACAKPVVMAIHGAALGGGLELAMAGHYRIATADAQLGQPEVKIGLIPGAGGTQRLPRLVGLAEAARMCVSGEPISAAQALAAGLIDKIAEGDLMDAAVAFAERASGPRRTRDLPVVRGDLAAIAAKLKPQLIAPRAALEAVEAAALLPFEEGIAREAELFEYCLRSEQARALIHVFFGERTVGKVPDLPKETPVRTIRRAAVIGAGTMGGGIAMVLANAGVPVLLKEADEPSLDRGMEMIRANYARSLKSGRLTQAGIEERMSRITPGLSYEGFEGADLVIEAVFESLDLKKRVFAEVSPLLHERCLLASNTSTLNIDAMAAETPHPENVLGLHFFSPAPVMRLLEIVRAENTSPDALATALALAKQLKKVGVVARNTFGFIGNRIFIPYMDEAQRLVEEGATPEQVDRVLTEFGMAMGPLAVADLSGLDVFWHVDQARPEGKGPESLEKLYRAGRLGQKTSAGWYRYGPDRKPQSDPAVLELVQTQHNEIADEEILKRCLRAMIEEGKRVLEEGVALRPVDIDIVFVTGYGFPAWRGGPMFYAERSGFFDSP